MTGKTHIIGGAAAAAVLLLRAQPVCSDPGSGILQILATPMLCLAGSLLPDLDLPTSLVGSSCRIVSKCINKLFGHRGFFHSLVFAALPLLTASLLCPQFTWAAIALSAGILSHITLDLLNSAGEALFWPSKKRVRIIGVKMGGLSETGIRALLVVGIFALAGVKAAHLFNI